MRTPERVTHTHTQMEKGREERLKTFENRRDKQREKDTGKERHRSDFIHHEVLIFLCSNKLHFKPCLPQKFRS